jgi:hypothetical protein
VSRVERNRRLGRAFEKAVRRKPLAPAPEDRIILNLDSELSPRPYSYCAYMRTYRVKRDHPGSDMTRLAGYTTCVPSKRFEMRSAVQRGRSSPRTVLLRPNRFCAHRPL